MSKSTLVPSTPERIEGGWRVATQCRLCRVELVLDSQDEMPAEELWRTEVEPEERGTIVSLPKPNAHALAIAHNGMICDECAVKLDSSEDRRQDGIIFRSRLLKSGLPKSLRELRWNEMDREGGRREAVVGARVWVEQGGGLFLSGPVGVGKTRLAATAVWDALHKRLVRWSSVPVLMAQVNASFDDDAKREATQILTGTDPLVLDDLGKENPKDFARQVLFAAIDRRIQEGSPLLITSNLDADQIGQRLGDAFASRIAGYCKQYALVGNDRRIVS